MILFSRFNPISLADIRLDDTRFQITAQEENIPSLARSIQTMGLICPPTVWPCNGAYIPVSGFRRIRAIQALSGMETLVCRIMPADAEAACAVHAVADNAFSRELTPVEQVRAVHLLRRFMDSEQMAQESMGIFNKKLNPRFITELLAVSALPPKAITLLQNGCLALKPAKRLTGCSKETLYALVDIFAKIKASSGKQLDIITCFTEVCKKEKMAAYSLFQEPGMQAALNRDTTDLGQKADQVRQYLARRRFPVLEQTRQQIRSHLGRLQSGGDFRFNLPENFESITYGVSFEFTTMDEFSQRARALAAMSEDPDLNAVLKR